MSWLIIILLPECMYVCYFSRASKNENTAHQIPCTLKKKKKFPVRTLTLTVVCFVASII